MALKARQKTRTTRKVLAMMLSSHNHMEFVEVTAVIAQNLDDNVSFFGDLTKIEEAARRRMSEEGTTFGAWADSPEQFELFHAVTAAYDPLARGRVAAVTQVPTKLVEDWSGTEREQEEAL